MKREQDDIDLPDAVRQKTDTSDFIVAKSLITNKQAAILIGESGATIDRIKEQTGLAIEVSDFITGALERLLTITGPVEQVSQAYGRCIKIMLGEAVDQNAPEEGFEFSLKLVLQYVYINALYGQGSFKLRDIADETGAKIKPCEFLLPLSSERAITISGTVTTITTALSQIGQVMLPLKSKAELSISMPYVPVTMYGRYGHPQHFKHVGLNDTMKTPSNPYGIAPSAQTQTQSDEQFANIPEVRTGPSRNLKDKLTQQIYIPNDMVGAIIGKQGSKINEIRNLSGSHIKINEPDPNRPNERLITVEGTGEQNQIALYMLYQRLESEKRRL